MAEVRKQQQFAQKEVATTASAATIFTSEAETTTQFSFTLPEPTFHSYYEERVCNHWSCETNFCYHGESSQPSEEYSAMLRSSSDFGQKVTTSPSDLHKDMDGPSTVRRRRSSGVIPSIAVEAIESLTINTPNRSTVGLPCQPTSSAEDGDGVKDDSSGDSSGKEETLPQHENRWSLRSSITEKTYEVDDHVVELSGGRSGLYTGTLDRSGNPHGQGRLDFDDGRIYEGSWINGDFSGFGKLVDSSADTVYEGGFFDNYRHGCGVLHFSDGKVFDGNFKFDKFGKGKLKFPDGSQFWGHVTEDGSTPHGRGKFNYSDGCVFDGEFQSGIRQGHGRMTWPEPDGRWYLGEWSEGEKHGLGMEVKADGTLLFEGIFNKGVPVESSSFPEIKHSDEENSVLLYRSSNACCANTLVGPMPQRICMRKKLHVPLINYSE